MDMLNGELRRLENEKIPKSSINKIKEFLTYLKSREELSDKRLYFYSNYLRTIARTMGKEFVNPSDQDIEKAYSDHVTEIDEKLKAQEFLHIIVNSY